jgi:hypothetical protein
MLKRLLLVCLILFILLPHAQSQHDQPIPFYRLEPVDWLDKDKEYTVISHSSPVIADQIMLVLRGTGIEADLASSADITQTVMNGSALLEQGFHVLSISPDGRRILCSEGNHFYILMGSTLRAVALNLSRCAMNNREGMSQSIWYASLKPSRMVGVEGYVWSPDGKHLCLTNTKISLTQMRSVPLMLIDTEKGEIFSVKAYQKGSIGMFSTAMQGLFSADSRYLYYTEYLGGTTRLCRYDLTNETHKLLVNTRERLLPFPGLGMNAQGEIISLIAGIRHSVLLAFKEGPAGWVFRQSPLFSTSIIYFALSGEGSLTESVLHSALVKPEYNLSIGGQPYRLEVQLNEQQAVRFILSAPFETTAEINTYHKGISIEQTGKPFICHVAMAPGGSRYLLVIKPDNSISPVSFWAMDARTGQTQAVLTPEEMDIYQPTWTRGRAAYQPGIVFLSEDLLLVPDIAGHTQLYRLVRNSPF